MDFLYAGHVVQASIKTYNAGMGTYVVDAPGFPDAVAADTAGGLNTLGARCYSTHAPGTPVLVWFATPEAEGIILGGIPRYDREDLALRGTMLAEGAGVGVGYDQVHRKPLRLDVKPDDQFPVPSMDKGTGRPRDLLAGDHGAVNELGVGYSVLKFTAQLHAGYANVSVSYVDNTVRLTGDRILMESPSMEHDHFQDQGESSTIHRSTPYQWEGMGAPLPGDDPANNEDRELSPEFNGEEQLSIWDVETWDQVGIFRYMELEGYLGGLMHSWAILPPEEQLPVTRDRELNWPGVAEHQVNVDGFITIRTAKGLLLEKTAMIPVPQQKLDPWDPEGDKDADCDWGKDAYDSDKVDYDWGDEDPTSRAGRAIDHNLFRTGEANVRALLDHVKDWSVPQETDIPAAAGAVPMSPLGTKFHADLPTAKTRRVDHRRTAVKYYPGRSFILFGDDGSITFQDAYGSSLVMSGGNVELCPRGDLLVRPGRSVINMAPRDIILNAGHAVEVATSKGDVRIKSERNLHALAGNSGEGGILLESRADDTTGAMNDFEEQGEGSLSSGVTIKSKNAPFAVWGSKIFMQSWDEGIVIDAGKGLKDLDLLGKDVRMVGYRSSSLIAGVKPGTGGGEPENADMIKVEGNSASILAGGVLAKFAGSSFRMLKDGGGSANMLVGGGLNVTGVIASPSTEISPLEPANMVPSIADLKAEVHEESTDFVTAWNELEAEVYTSTSGFGNTEFARKFSFSFNKSLLYWTDTDFVLNATYWQMRYAATGGRTWDQPVVVFQERESIQTRPWPGHESWAGNSFGKIEAGGFNNVDVATEAGKTVPRDDTAGAAPTMVPLEGNYTIDQQE